MRGLRTVRRTLDEQDARRRGVAADEVDKPPGVQWRWDHDGQLVLWGRLRADDGARVLAGLSRMDEQRRRAESNAASEGGTDGACCGQLRSAEHSRSLPGTSGVAPSDLAPALVAAGELLCTTVESPVHAPAADVVVHVAADTLVASAFGPTPDTPEARVDDGPHVSLQVLRTLACDGRIRLSVHGVDGRTLALGRRRRRPSRRQLDALWRRDRGCRAPGCGRTRFLHAHHVRAWAAGGRTDMDNLLLLCGEHHRLLHEGGFSIVALGQQRFRFHGPRGAVRPQVPPLSGSLGDLTHAYPDITADTIEPDWDGSPLHLEHATDVYLTAWTLRAGKAGS